jgi:hypothetical protein
MSQLKIWRANVISNSMQKIIMKFLIAVLLFPGFLFAQVEGSKTEQTVSAMIIHAKIVSVNIIAKTIIVKTKKAQDTLNVGSGAKIMLGRAELSKEITLVDLQNGVNVSVTWELIDGKKTATKIVEEYAADFKKEGGSDLDREQ